MFGIDGGLISLIQSVLLIISAILIIVASVGVLKIDRNLENVVYARIHILGIVDIAGIIAFIALGQPLFALIYLFLAPLLAHALANAYFHGEDTHNNPVLNPNIMEEGETFEEDENVSSDTPIDEDLDLSDDSTIDEESGEDLDLSDDSGIDENVDEKSEDDGND
jgi:energy-converting hydrogenase B subunit C